MADKADPATRPILAELKKLGTAQNRKVFARHGVAGDHFGVSYANLDKLAKKYRAQPELAAPLWASGWLDARTLATKIAGPASLPKKTAQAWARDLDNSVISCDLAALLSQAPYAQGLADIWIARSPKTSHWVVYTGWGIVGGLADYRRDEGPPNSWFLGLLKEIETKIATAPNMLRYAMNDALIGIGCRNKTLRQKAEAAAKRIGHVEVDHGQTSCTTPDALAYIAKTWAYREKKKR